MPKGRTRSSAREPRIVEMAPQRMAVVQFTGDPEQEFEKVMPALYGSVYTLKFDLKKRGIEFKVGKLRARWPDAHLLPKGQWTGIVGLPIPDDVTELPQKKPEIEVRIETWEYGTVAEILHVGPYSEEGPTIERLHAFVEEEGYEVTGPHEEEYLTSPRAKTIRTMLRCEVRKKR